MGEVKLYAERDLMGLDRAGNHYCKHILAMTKEGLHAKSDIAAELAFRDFELDTLREELTIAKRNEHNSEVAYKAAIERQGELREDLELTKNGDLKYKALLEQEGEIKSLQQRLADAERRNAKLVELLGRWASGFGHLGGIATTLRDETKTALKPTESGASE